MESLNTKVTGSTLTAAEWNQVPSELQNVITQTGQALTAADLDQVGKGVAQYAGNGDFYTDSGAANAYVLATLNGKQATTAYVDGLRIRFVPGNTNTSASTVNVATLGVVDIVNVNGDPMTGGELTSGQLAEAYYDAGNSRFQQLPQINASNFVSLKSGRKNFLINGAFDCWQRSTPITTLGTGSLASAEYGPDRWVVYATAGAPDVTTIRGFAPNSENRGQSFLQLFTDLSAHTTVQLGQFIEIKLGGKTLTCTIEVSQQAGAPTVIPTLSVEIRDGTRGFISAVVTNSPFASVPGDGGNYIRSQTFTMPADTSSEDRFVYVEIAIPARNFATFAFDFYNIQVEESPTFSSFDVLPVEETVTLCERYYEKSYDFLTSPGTASNAGSVSEPATRNAATNVTGLSFRVRKRVVPTVATYATFTGTINSVTNNGDQAATPSTIGETGVNVISVPTGVTGFDASYQWTADAEV